MKARSAEEKHSAWKKSKKDGSEGKFRRGLGSLNTPLETGTLHGTSRLIRKEL